MKHARVVSTVDVRSFALTVLLKLAIVSPTTSFSRVPSYISPDSKEASLALRPHRTAVLFSLKPLMLGRRSAVGVVITIFCFRTANPTLNTVKAGRLLYIEEYRKEAKTPLSSAASVVMSSSQYYSPEMEELANELMIEESFSHEKSYFSQKSSFSQETPGYDPKPDRKPSAGTRSQHTSKNNHGVTSPYGIVVRKSRSLSIVTNDDSRNDNEESRFTGNTSTRSEKSRNWMQKAIASRRHVRSMSRDRSQSLDIRAESPATVADQTDVEEFDDIIAHNETRWSPKRSLRSKSLPRSKLTLNTSVDQSTKQNTAVERSKRKEEVSSNFSNNLKFYTASSLVPTIGTAQTNNRVRAKSLPPKSPKGNSAAKRIKDLKESIANTEQTYYLQQMNLLNTRNAQPLQIFVSDNATSGYPLQSQEQAARIQQTLATTESPSPVDKSKSKSGGFGRLDFKSRVKSVRNARLATKKGDQQSPRKKSESSANPVHPKEQSASSEEDLRDTEAACHKQDDAAKKESSFFNQKKAQTPTRPTNRLQSPRISDRVTLLHSKMSASSESSMSRWLPSPRALSSPRRRFGMFRKESKETKRQEPAKVEYTDLSNTLSAESSSSELEHNILPKNVDKNSIGGDAIEHRVEEDLDPSESSKSSFASCLHQFEPNMTTPTTAVSQGGEQQRVLADETPIRKLRPPSAQGFSTPSDGSDSDFKSKQFHSVTQVAKDNGSVSTVSSLGSLRNTVSRGDTTITTAELDQGGRSHFDQEIDRTAIIAKTTVSSERFTPFPTWHQSSAHRITSSKHKQPASKTTTPNDDTSDTVKLTASAVNEVPAREKEGLLALRNVFEMKREHNGLDSNQAAIMRQHPTIVESQVPPVSHLPNRRTADESLAIERVVDRTTEAVDSNADPLAAIGVGNECTDSDNFGSEPCKSNIQFKSLQLRHAAFESACKDSATVHLASRTWNIKPNIVQRTTNAADQPTWDIEANLVQRTTDAANQPTASKAEPSPQNSEIAAPNEETLAPTKPPRGIVMTSSSPYSRKFAPSNPPAARTWNTNANVVSSVAQRTTNAVAHVTVSQAESSPQNAEINGRNEVTMSPTKPARPTSMTSSAPDSRNVVPSNPWIRSVKLKDTKARVPQKQHISKPSSQPRQSPVVYPVEMKQFFPDAEDLVAASTSKSIIDDRGHCAVFRTDPTSNSEQKHAMDGVTDAYANFYAAEQQIEPPLKGQTVTLTDRRWHFESRDVDGDNDSSKVFSAHANSSNLDHRIDRVSEDDFLTTAEEPSAQPTQTNNSGLADRLSIFESRNTSEQRESKFKYSPWKPKPNDSTKARLASNPPKEVDGEELYQGDAGDPHNRKVMYTRPGLEKLRDKVPQDFKVPPNVEATQLNHLAHDKLSDSASLSTDCTTQPANAVSPAHKARSFFQSKCKESVGSSSSSSSTEHFSSTALRMNAQPRTSSRNPFYKLGNDATPSEEVSTAFVSNNPDHDQQNVDNSQASILPSNDSQILRSGFPSKSPKSPGRSVQSAANKNYSESIGSESGKPSWTTTSHADKNTKISSKSIVCAMYSGRPRKYSAGKGHPPICSTHLVDAKNEQASCPIGPSTSPRHKTPSSSPTKTQKPVSPYKKIRGMYEFGAHVSNKKSGHRPTSSTQSSCFNQLQAESPTRQKQSSSNISESKFNVQEMTSGENITQPEAVESPRTTEVKKSSPVVLSGGKESWRFWNSTSRNSAQSSTPLKSGRLYQRGFIQSNQTQSETETETETETDKYPELVKPETDGAKPRHGVSPPQSDDSDRPQISPVKKVSPAVIVPGSKDSWKFWNTTSGNARKSPMVLRKSRSFHTKVQGEVIDAPESPTKTKQHRRSKSCAPKEVISTSEKTTDTGTTTRLEVREQQQPAQEDEADSHPKELQQSSSFAGRKHIFGSPIALPSRKRGDIKHAHVVDSYNFAGVTNMKESTGHSISSGKGRMTEGGDEEKVAEEEDYFARDAAPTCEDPMSPTTNAIVKPRRQAVDFSASRAIFESVRPTSGVTQKTKQPCDTTATNKKTRSKSIPAKFDRLTEEYNGPEQDGCDETKKGDFELTFTEPPVGKTRGRELTRSTSFRERRKLFESPSSKSRQNVPPKKQWSVPPVVDQTQRFHHTAEPDTAFIVDDAIGNATIETANEETTDYKVQSFHQLGTTVTVAKSRGVFHPKPPSSNNITTPKLKRSQSNGSSVDGTSQYDNESASKSDVGVPTHGNNAFLLTGLSTAEKRSFFESRKEVTSKSGDSSSYRSLGSRHFEELEIDRQAKAKEATMPSNIAKAEICKAVFDSIESEGPSFELEIDRQARERIVVAAAPTPRSLNKHRKEIVENVSTFAALSDPKSRTAATSFFLPQQIEPSAITETTPVQGKSRWQDRRRFGQEEPQNTTTSSQQFYPDQNSQRVVTKPIPDSAEQPRESPEQLQNPQAVRTRQDSALHNNDGAEVYMMPSKTKARVSSWMQNERATKPSRFSIPKPGENPITDRTATVGSAKKPKFSSRVSRTSPRAKKGGGGGDMYHQNMAWIKNGVDSSGQVFPEDTNDNNASAMNPPFYDIWYDEEGRDDFDTCSSLGDYNEHKLPVVFDTDFPAPIFEEDDDGDDMPRMAPPLAAFNRDMNPRYPSRSQEHRQF